MSERKRVKVYELRENDWFDRGTGFCEVQIIQVGLSCLAKSALSSCETLDDEDDNVITSSYLQADGRIYVESEDEPERALLEVKIKKDDNYQRQQGTIEPGNDDTMAYTYQTHLSFGPTRRAWTWR